jgi:hypothetical protein
MAEGSNAAWLWNNPVSVWEMMELCLNPVISEAWMKGSPGVHPHLLTCDLTHMERPTELKHITQWRNSKQPRLLQ